MSEEIKSWETIDSSVVAEAPIFSIRKVKRQPPWDAPAADFFVVDLPDWVNVIAVTDDDRVVLIKQYRHGTDAITLEIPGGNVDPDESFLSAAQRELEEETGYVSDDWREIGTVEPNPAIQSNRCVTFLAVNARPVGTTAPDEHEDIAIHLTPYDEIPTLIDGGLITHALVVAAFAHADRKKMNNA